MNRCKAAALHAIASLLLVGLVAAIVLLLWHPWGLYRISGVRPLLGMLLLLLLISGPLLTLTVYKPGKPGLHMDLAVVGLLQFAVLGFGLHLLWQTRPVFVVASDARFAVVLANELEDADLAVASRQEWSFLPWGRPLLVGLRLDNRRNSVLSTLLDTGMDHALQPARYVPYAEVAPRLMFATTASNASGQPAADSSAPEFRSLPIVARHGSGRLILNADTLQPLKVVTY